MMPIFRLYRRLIGETLIDRPRRALPAPRARRLPMRPAARRHRYAALVALLLCACAKPPARPNVLLITIDTLRADHLSLATTPDPDQRASSPRLAELAADGVVFLSAASPRAKTTPSVASIMTGLYPHEHGVRDLTSPLPAGVPVLAEAFRRAGYVTGAVIGNTVLRRELAGLHRGFDRWVQELPQTQGVPPDDVPQRTADSLTDGALATLGLANGDDAGLASDGSPWFLWLHYMDPHGLYDPPPSHRIFRAGVPDLIPGPPDVSTSPLHRQWVAGYNIPAKAITPEGMVDAAAVRDLYDGEIHFADAEIGRLIDRLRAAGQLADTLVVVTSDHGESLGEHDYWFEHGRYAYEATTHVPLIVRLPSGHPDAAARGTRAGSISLVDLAPTLLEWVGLEPLPGSETPSLSPRGRSRADLLRRDSNRPHPVYAEKVEALDLSGAVQTKVVRAGPWKLHRRYAAVPGPSGDELSLLREELYDLRRDPAEARNLIDAPPAEAPLAELRLLLLRFIEADTEFATIGRRLAEEREQLARDHPEALRELQALGYVDAASEPVAPR
jgi:arylsulfatase A-like enzyme